MLLSRSPEEAPDLVDLLAVAGAGGAAAVVHRFERTRVATANTHGTGWCVGALSLDSLPQ